LFFLFGRNGSLFIYLLNASFPLKPLSAWLMHGKREAVSVQATQRATQLWKRVHAVQEPAGGGQLSAACLLCLGFFFFPFFL
jgi:hypothetical protein